MPPSVLLPPYDLVPHDLAPDSYIAPLEHIAERLERGIATVKQMEKNLSPTTAPLPQYSASAITDRRQLLVEDGVSQLAGETGRFLQLRMELDKVERDRLQLLLWEMMRRSRGSHAKLEELIREEERKAQQYRIALAYEDGPSGAERAFKNDAHNVQAHSDVVDLRLKRLAALLSSVRNGTSFSELAEQYGVSCPVEDATQSAGRPASVGVHTDSEEENERNDLRRRKRNLRKWLGRQ
ncbi:hypothetical protein JCM8547_008747 [Rhodosporidiobolus lusitaniae]